MLPDPLHPAVVHFPISLVVFLPIVALLALWAIRRGAPTRRVWAVPLAVAALLVASSWAALLTGEADGERVAPVIGESLIHAHEEAAERFVVLAGVLLLIGASGMAPGTLGRAGRLLTTVGAIGLLVSGIQVAAAGGELVYHHGAASAYLPGPSPSGFSVPRAARPQHDDDTRTPEER
jgi:uncharacterized membrane protein